MTNENWHRWTYATFQKSLLTDAAAALPAIPLVVEFGNSKRTPTWEDATTKAEVTITGPRTKSTSPTRVLAWVDVFIVVTTNITANNSGHLDAVGVLVKALDKCFQVKDYGDTGLLDIGIFQPRDDDAEGINATHLKPTQEDTQIHSTILARYDGRFSN